MNDNRKPNITWKMKKKGRLCVGHCVECARRCSGVMRNGGERGKAVRGTGNTCFCWISWLVKAQAHQSSASTCSLPVTGRILFAFANSHKHLLAHTSVLRLLYSIYSVCSLV